jgi:hypothetical protein
MEGQGGKFRKSFPTNKEKKMSVQFKENEDSGGNHYEVYIASNYEEALEFLRGKEVKNEKHYVIAETPQGSWGKDMIMIFNERTSSFIEYGTRNRLPKIKTSLSECGGCGYPVFPYPRQIKDMHLVLLLDEDLKKKGYGFFCPTCQTLWCSICIDFSHAHIETPDNMPACKICGKPLELYQE